MKMNCANFVPKLHSNFKINEIDEKSNESVTTKDNSDIMSIE
jgi:hypothetical protein